MKKTSLLVTLYASLALATGVAAQDRVVRVGDNGLQPPRKLVDVAPEYPPEAEEAGVGGIVVLDITVNPDGVPLADMEVRRAPEPDYGLVAAAVAAVRQWRYEPTHLNGEPVSVSFFVTINFQVSRDQPGPRE